MQNSQLCYETPFKLDVCTRSLITTTILQTQGKKNFTFKKWIYSTVKYF